MKYKLLDVIGKHFMDLAVTELKTGGTFVFVLDNIDWMEKVHKYQCSCSCLSDSGPQNSLEKCDINKLVSLTPVEEQQIRERYKL